MPTPHGGEESGGGEGDGFGVGVGEAEEFATGSTKGVCTFHGAMKYEENLWWTGAIDWFNLRCNAVAKGIVIEGQRQGRRKRKRLAEKVDSILLFHYNNKKDQLDPKLMVPTRDSTYVLNSIIKQA